MPAGTTPGDGPGQRDWTKRNVLVIGGTSGIGAAIARRFDEAGASVTAAGLAVRHGTESVGNSTCVVEIDLREPAQVADVIAGLPSMDVLVNAAGVLRRDQEFEPDVFSDVVAVNLTGAMRACVAAKPLLAGAAGCIVNVASMLSYMGGPRVPAYSASKGGVVQLTKSLAVAWAAEGIRVNAVAPGWIRTALTAELHGNPELAEKITDRTPMRRWGEAIEVAGAVEFLAGPDAAFITGAVLPVDGGYLAM